LKEYSYAYALVTTALSPKLGWECSEAFC
jgi:hypothetical protein